MMEEGDILPEALQDLPNRGEMKSPEGEKTAEGRQHLAGETCTFTHSISEITSLRTQHQGGGCSFSAE